MTPLLLSAVFFVAIHLGVAGTRLRDRVVERLGPGGYSIAFSLASLAGIWWLVGSYRAAPYIETWGQPEWWKPIAIVLMVPAFLLAVTGLITPNPTTVGQEALLSRTPTGIVRVTRHPFLVGVGLWAAVHLIANGDLASAVLFGCLVLVCAVGPASIDAKRRRLLGEERWAAFARATSIVPFLAAAQGRTTILWERGFLMRLGVALLLYGLMLGGHSHIIGVSPFPA